MPKAVETILQIAMALIGAYAAAFWFCLVVWTFRDIQKRTRDVIVQILATLLVLLFNVPGLVLYLILRPPDTLSQVYARQLEEEALLRDIQVRGACPRCGGRADPDFKQCPACGMQLREPCESCGRLLELDWTLCPYCGVTRNRGAVPQTPIAAS